MLQFAPTILYGESVTELPRPIIVCRLHDSWDFMKLKVPRRDGDQVAGPSRDGVDLTIEGQIGTHLGEVKLSEETMLETVQTLRSALHVVDDEGYALALFRDATNEYRYFRNCLTSRLDIDFSNPRIYSYSISIHVADPALYHGIPS